MKKIGRNLKTKKFEKRILFTTLPSLLFLASFSYLSRKKVVVSTILPQEILLQEESIDSKKTEQLSDAVSLKLISTISLGAGAVIWASYVGIIQGGLSNLILNRLETFQTISKKDNYNSMDSRLANELAIKIVLYLRDQNGNFAIEKFILSLGTDDIFAKREDNSFSLFSLKELIKELQMKQKLSEAEIKEELNKKFIKPIIDGLLPSIEIYPIRVNDRKNNTKSQLDISIFDEPINENIDLQVDDSIAIQNPLPLSSERKIVDININKDLHHYLGVSSKVGRFLWLIKSHIYEVTRFDIRTEIIKSAEKARLIIVPEDHLSTDFAIVDGEVLLKRDRNSSPIQSQSSHKFNSFNKRTGNNLLEIAISKIKDSDLIDLDLENEEKILKIEGFRDMNENQQITFLNELRKRKTELIFKLANLGIKLEDLDLDLGKERSQGPERIKERSHRSHTEKREYEDSIGVELLNYDLENEVVQEELIKGLKKDDGSLSLRADAILSNAFYLQYRAREERKKKQYRNNLFFWWRKK